MAKAERAGATDSDGGLPLKLGLAPAPPRRSERAETIPVRILNEDVDCPRLAFLE